jgi:hypothetical protein
MTTQPNKDREMSKHTEGPWFMWSRDMKHGVTSIGVRMPEGKRTKYDAVPYCVMGGYELEDEAIMEANAQLIAKAPEMLHELKVARGMYEHYNETERAQRVGALITEIESE